jgi:hypothetical protein
MPDDAKVVSPAPSRRPPAQWVEAVRVVAMELS